MKATTLTITCILISIGLLAQTPQGISHQAVVRDAQGQLVTNATIGIQVSILKGTAEGTVVYSETHDPISNMNGLVTYVIGEGTVVEGVFADIDWSDGPYFLKTEVDPTGGTNYSIIGTTQLLSVPYALLSKSTENEADPLFSTSPASAVTSTNITNWNNAYSWGDHAGMYRQASWVPLWMDVTEKPSVFTPSAHTHGNITNDGKIGSAANRVIVTGTDGTLTTLNAGTTNQYLRGDGVWESPLPAGTADGQMLYWNGSAWIKVAPGNTGHVLTLHNGVPTWVAIGAAIGSSTDVYNSTTGKFWMDRNLGATQIATSSTDVNSYGDLYQWGRGSDGHQIRTSGTTTTLSSSDTPGHGNFILASDYPYDWRSSQNANLWQGVNGVNNPCPPGYRLPTEAEWEEERLSWISNDSDGAFASPLKLPVAGARNYSNGLLDSVGWGGRYWSSTLDGSASRYLLFYSTNSAVISFYRADGYSVRCIKD